MFKIKGVKVTKSIFQDKYPVFTKNFSKESLGKDIDGICKFFQEKVNKDDDATFISLFDNFAHTNSINGEINPEVKGAKSVVFCFGKAIPNSAILAVRPRSIGVVEYNDSFDVCFLEAPNEGIQKCMEKWVEDLRG